ncbi:hypothetical protein VNO80_32296 [Phaseolus coccineus]|uniref:Uncharacterized protein n=1 Tax=Phaseolus coccineus TaxID=3886 RepID=A0AAN9Q9B4_PHACN
MVHGILQFTPSIAFRYVLHRCKSRDIRCRESFYITCRREGTRGTRPRLPHLTASYSLAHEAPGLVFCRETRACDRMHRVARPPSRRRTREDEPQPLCAVCLIRIRGSNWFSGLLTTSRAADRPRRRNPNTSPDHSIGRSDGRCVQRAGT